MHKPLWGSFAPLKGKIFGWLALRYRLWTSDRRQRHGLQEHMAPRFTCLDTVDHVLVQCPYARQVWYDCLQEAGINIVEPRSDSTLESWWSAARELVCRKDRVGSDTMVILTAWRLWKQRNARVFNNAAQQFSTQQLVLRIKEEFSLWKLARGRGSDLMPRE
jgi:hypothetical protein